MADLRKRKRWFMAAVTAVLLVFLAVMAYSYWSVPGNTLNFLTMSSYQTNIVEKYEIPDSVNPSDKISKMVNVSNTGTVDTLIRVSVKKAFGVRKKDGTFQADDTLNPELIEIQYNHTYWVQKKDGYFYYKDVLKAGETTKEPLFRSYRLSEKAGNRYKGKDAEIVVSMESVQAAGDAISLWGMTYKELGIERPEQEESIDTAVHYLGREKGFDISRTKTDLFASFKNLLPGCARTQVVRIYNDSDEQAELFLRAESTGQEAMSSEQLRMVRQLLNQYGIIRIKGENGEIYHGPVSGTASGSGNSMEDNISLGQFTPGEMKKLTVTLSLDSAMDNQFQKLTGKVKWVFSAVGEEQTSEWPISVSIPPKTGDSTGVGMWAALLVVSAVFLTAAFGLAKRSRRSEEKQ